MVAYDFNDPNVEPRPDCVVYQPVFKALKEHCTQLKNLLLNSLTESAYSNVITRGLLQEVHNRTRDNAPDEAMFAVAGDMNSGECPTGLKTILRS